MEISIHRGFKSIPKGMSFKAPSFCVLTGKNGSGKSHLLEAISDRDCASVLKNSAQVNNILYVRFGGLTASIEDACEPSAISQELFNIWHQIHNIKEQHKYNVGEDATSASTEEYLTSIENTMAGAQILRNIMTTTGKKINDIHESDILHHITFISPNKNSLFSAQFAFIFKGYQYRKEKNDLTKIRASREPESNYTYFSDSEFINTYGPPPWELVNEILSTANLPYQISRPDHVDFEGPYNVRLIDKSRGVNISVEELSTGEKVLLSLAVAIFTTTEGGTLPNLLLLDEPDAPLHPQFSKKLIDILNEIIVKKHGINVIMSTHSPSTVALAPDDSVFEINALTRTPFMVTNSHALRTLTNGIEFLRVSFEKRRQIFVESKNDVQYYELLFQILCRRHKFYFQPVFLEPHNKVRESSNCTDVIRIVERLREAGNDLVRGLIDWDTTNEPKENISILGGGNRYAIENYILEPLYICLSLIRAGRKDYADFGVTREHLTYTDASSLSQSECQIMIDCLLNQIDLPLTDLKDTKLDNGFTLKYPTSFLSHHGHDYETKLDNTFIELKSVARGQALKLGVLHTIKENPHFLPVEISETFFCLLDADS